VVLTDIAPNTVEPDDTGIRPAIHLTINGGRATFTP
jgi:hypothetical protein